MIEDKITSIAELKKRVEEALMFQRFLKPNVLDLISEFEASVKDRIDECRKATLNHTYFGYGFDERACEQVIEELRRILGEGRGEARWLR